MSVTKMVGKLDMRILLVAALCLAIFSFATTSASAVEQIESFHFGVTDLGGAPTQQAGGHPDQTATTFVFANQENPEGKILPLESPRNVKVNLPAGMVGSATAVPTCKEAQLTANFAPTSCPNDSAVGFVSLEVPATGFCSSCGFPGPLLFPIYNMQAPPGEAAEFGFNAIENVVHLVAHVRSEPEYGISITATNTPQGLALIGFTTTFWGVPADPSHDTLRGNCLTAFGPSGSECPSDVAQIRPLLTNPTACSPSLTAVARVDSWTNTGVFAEASSANENNSGQAVGIDGCSSLPFAPEIEGRPTTESGDSPSGLDVKLHVPQNEDPKGIASSQLKDATLTFPPGLTINPSSAAGLEACSPEQVGLLSRVGEPKALFDEIPVSCPDASKLGKVSIETPLLANPLEGAIYLATQNENPFGSLLGLYIVVEDPTTGVILKLAGHPVADPQTGQLTVIFDQNPQLPFEDLQVELFPGARAALRTPMTCGEYTTSSDLSPWTSPEGADKTPSAKFALSKNCVSGESGAPNKPSFSAGTTSSTAGAFSPFVLKVSREDGTQPLKSIETTLPKGLLGRLSGTPYCPDTALAAAAGKSGKDEQASPSCPSDSQVGTVAVGAGAGPTPLYVGGKVYLAGPYKGAPLSLAIITPAVAGPFDLGNVVVRTALQVDPVTTQIHAVSDPIPTILQGIPLDVRSIALTIDRSQFTVNPTNCEPTAVLAGTTSVFDQTASLSSPFQVGGCGALAFKPKLSLGLSGATRRGKDPALKAVLTASAGQANIGRVAVILPKSVFIDQGHVGNPCTRVQFAEGDGNGSACPAKSILGKATAYSPLLGKPLTGNVYFRSNGGERKLPDLVASLGGQIHVDLVGFIDSVHQKGIEGSRVRNTFASVPDAPVSRFVLELKGGKKGLLQNSADLCRSTNKATVKMNGQNGKIADSETVVKPSCGSKKKGKGK
jgi:hypothetical protein